MISCGSGCRPTCGLISVSAWEPSLLSRCIRLSPPVPPASLSLPNDSNPLSSSLPHRTSPYPACSAPRTRSRPSQPDIWFHGHPVTTPAERSKASQAPSFFSISICSLRHSPPPSHLHYSSQLLPPPPPSPGYFSAISWGHCSLHHYQLLQLLPSSHLH